MAVKPPDNYKLLGTYRSLQYTIEFKKEEKTVFAEYFSGLFPIQRISIDQHTFAQITDPNLSLSKIVKRHLAEQYIPSIQNGKLEWTPPSIVIDRAAKVEQCLSQAEDDIRKKKYPQAVNALLEAQAHATQVQDPFGEAHFLEKLDRDWLESLYEKTQDPRIEFLLLQKDAVRRAFEIALQKISAHSPQPQKPTCFICFSMDGEEKDIQDWVEYTFVPDLDIIGVKPVYCFRDLGPSKELHSFEELITITDLAVIMCTPGLKKKCEKTQGHSSGAALEVDLAKLRRENPHHQETLYPIYLRGKFPTLCPSPIIQLILGTELTFFGPNTPDQLYSYYARSFELFGKMRKIDREYSRKVIKKEFLKDIHIILKDRIIDRDAVLIWRNEKSKRIQAAKASVPATAEELNSRILIPRDRLSLNTPHPNFVGRKSLLEKLETDFQLQVWKITDPTKVRILCGPGGIGKTELAIKFGNLHLSSFSLIWFIHTESPQLFEEDYRNLAIALKIFIENDDLAAIKRKVHKALEREGYFSKPWLLIFDNVDKALTIPQRGGYVIVTSQIKNIWPDPTAFIHIPSFTLEETEQLFQQLECPTPKSELPPLFKEAEGFPVLLEQMGRFLARTSCPVPEYLRQLNTENDLLWTEIEGQRYPKVLGKVFEKSLDQLQKSHPHAYAFIQFCGYLSPDHISIELLEFWVEQQKLPLTQKWLIVGALKDSMLIRFHDSTQSFSIHRLLQIVIQRLHEKKQENLYLSLVQFLYLWSKKFDWNLVETWKIGEECAGHLEKIKRHPGWQAVDKRWRSNLLLAEGLWFSRVKVFPLQAQAEEFKIGAELIQEALKLAIGSYGEESKEVALCCSELGACYWKMGDNKTGHHYFVRSLEIRKKVLGEIHRDTGASYNNLSLTTAEGIEKQLEYRQKALEIWKKVYQGQPHPDIALAHMNIGILYDEIGIVEDVLSHFTIAVTIYENVYKTPHPATAQACMNLGSWLISRSPELALPELKKALEIYKTVYGEQHESVARSRIKIAKLYLNLKQPIPALKEYDQVLKIYQKLGVNSALKRAEVYMFQGDVFQETGHLEDALVIRQEGLKIFQSIHIEPHPNLVCGYFDNGRSFSQLERPIEALLYFQEALHLAKIVLPNHPVIAAINNNIGAMLEVLNRHIEALSYFVEAFKLGFRFKNNRLPNFFKSSIDSLHKQTDIAFATKVKEELLAFCIAECGEGSDFTAKVRNFTFQSKASGPQGSSDGGSGCSTM